MGRARGREARQPLAGPSLAAAEDPFPPGSLLLAEGDVPVEGRGEWTGRTCPSNESIAVPLSPSY